MSCWRCGNILVSYYLNVAGLNNLFKCYIFELNAVNSVKTFKVRSHDAVAVTLPLSIGFQSHSVRQRQWQSNIQYNAKYFATATAAQNGVGTYLLATLLLQLLLQVLV